MLRLSQVDVVGVVGDVESSVIRCPFVNIPILYRFLRSFSQRSRSLLSRSPLLYFLVLPNALGLPDR